MLLGVHGNASTVDTANTSGGGGGVATDVLRVKVDFSQLPSTERSLLNIFFCVMIENFQWESFSSWKNKNKKQS